MCVTRDNVSDEEWEKYDALLVSLGEESALGNFLHAAKRIVQDFGGICIGAGPQEGPSDTPPPGIYPPDFNPN